MDEETKDRLDQINDKLDEMNTALIGDLSHAGQITKIWTAIRFLKLQAKWFWTCITLECVGIATLFKIYFQN